jgi:hypothetical protein
MKDVTQEGRWAQWIAQARNFAAREQFHDAVQRAKLVRKEIDKELARASDEDQRDRLRRQRQRVERLLEQVDRQRQQWHQRIDGLRKYRYEHAEDEMRRPLPKGLPGRTPLGRHRPQF